MGLILIEREDGNMDWIHSAQDGNQWKAALKWQLTFGFHKILGISWVAKQY
jgi:hypothetical protein